MEIGGAKCSSDFVVGMSRLHQVLRDNAWKPLNPLIFQREKAVSHAKKGKLFPLSWERQLPAQNQQARYGVVLWKISLPWRSGKSETVLPLLKKGDAKGASNTQTTAWRRQNNLGSNKTFDNWNKSLYPELGLTTLILYFIQTSEQQKTFNWDTSLLCYWNKVLCQKCLKRRDRCSLLVADLYLWIFSFLLDVKDLETQALLFQKT